MTDYLTEMSDRISRCGFYFVLDDIAGLKFTFSLAKSVGFCFSGQRFCNASLIKHCMRNRDKD